MKAGELPSHAGGTLEETRGLCIQLIGWGKLGLSSY